MLEPNALPPLDQANMRTLVDLAASKNCAPEDVLEEIRYWAAQGYTYRQIYKPAGFDRLGGATTRLIRNILNDPAQATQVAETAEAETFKDLGAFLAHQMPSAMNVLSRLVEGDETVTKEQAQAAWRILYQKYGKPSQRVITEHDIGERAAQTLQDFRSIAEELSGQLRPRLAGPVIDVEVDLVGDGESEAGGVGRGGHGAVHSEPRAVGGPP